jgi:hypothetical protein
MQPARAAEDSVSFGRFSTVSIHRSRSESPLRLLLVSGDGCQAAAA